MGDVSKTGVKRKADIEIERASERSKKSLEPQEKTPADVQRGEEEVAHVEFGVEV